MCSQHTEIMQSSSLRKDHICIVLIAFLPDADLFEKILGLSKQVEKIFVIDNTPSDESSTVSEIRYRILNSKENIQVDWFENGANIGQSSALNIGIKLAIDAGYQWGLTLDQDSIVPEDYVETMCSGYNKFILGQNSYSIASITPLLVSIEQAYAPAETHSNSAVFGLGGVEVQDDAQIVKRAITSGNIVNLNVLLEIGLFDEGFFIDFVDTEFSLRLKKNKYDILRVNTAYLFHSIGNATEHKIFSKPIKCSNHHPVRYYYFYRNATATLIRYLKWPTWHILSDIPKMMLFRLVVVLLFESNRFRKLSKIILGIFHGFLDIRGPFVR
jgi:rhamnosyltransferase